MAEIQRVRLSSGICSPVVLPVTSSGIGSSVVPPVGPTEVGSWVEEFEEGSVRRLAGGMGGRFTGCWSIGLLFGGSVCQRLSMRCNFHWWGGAR